ncbi:hypothetical protein DXG01_007490 [Tephrocybe rancida]|nr:hypothetical protein DXG01_007490 [Tephrocybe rancida]
MVCRIIGFVQVDPRLKAEDSERKPAVLQLSGPPSAFEKAPVHPVTSTPQKPAPLYTQNAQGHFVPVVEAMKEPIPIKAQDLEWDGWLDGNFECDFTYKEFDATDDLMTHWANTTGGGNHTGSTDANSWELGGDSFIDKFTMFETTHPDFVVLAAMGKTTVVSTQTSFMCSQLVKDQELNGPINGLVSDAAHGWWAVHNHLLMVTSVYCPVLLCWVPALLSFTNGASAQHFKYHFLALFQSISDEAEERQIEVEDRLLAGNASTIARNYPKLKDWVEWWAQAAHSTMIFKSEHKMDAHIWDSIPWTTNVEESMHWKAYSACGKDHMFSEGMNALNAFALHFE